MKNVKGFRIIEVPLSESLEGVHPLYIKEHSGNKVSKESAGKVLFVGNVDYRINMTHEDISEYLRLLFGRFGDVGDVSVSQLAADSTANSRCAHLEFTKKSSLKLALTAADDDYATACKEVCEQFGLDVRKKTAGEIKLMFSFVDVNPAELQEEVDAYMADFDEQEHIMRQEREERLNQVDEDGFMPVKNRNKRKRSQESGNITNEASDEHNYDSIDTNTRRTGAPRARKQSKKTTELKNFYRFQIKEEKIKDLDNLRKKFAEDRERVAKMKEQRKFKPF
eukprot:gene9212-10867_t